MCVRFQVWLEKINIFEREYVDATKRENAWEVLNLTKKKRKKSLKEVSCSIARECVCALGWVQIATKDNQHKMKKIKKECGLKWVQHATKDHQ